MKDHSEIFGFCLIFVQRRKRVKKKQVSFNSLNSFQSQKACFDLYRTVWINKSVRRIPKDTIRFSSTKNGYTRPKLYSVEALDSGYKMENQTLCFWFLKHCNSMYFI